MYIALIIEWNDKDKNLDDQMIAQSIVEILKKWFKKGC